MSEPARCSMSSDGPAEPTGANRFPQRGGACRRVYHTADMVKWLSSEVSNLMSWVRLPLSAPCLMNQDACFTGHHLVSIKGSAHEGRALITG